MSASAMMAKSPYTTSVMPLPPRPARPSSAACDPTETSFTSKTLQTPRPNLSFCSTARSFDTPSTFDRTGLSGFDRTQNSTFESYTTNGNNCVAIRRRGRIVAPCLVRLETNSPSPAQRSVQAGAQRANSYQFAPWGLLGGGAMVLRIVLALAVAWSAAAGAEETKVTLPSGRTLSLSGPWKAADKMWPDAALVFPGDNQDGGVTVICAGELKPRVIYREPWGGHDGNTQGIEFSNDGTMCFAWLHNAMQLTAINMKDASLKSLLRLPTHIWHYELLQHEDPHPVVKAHILFQVGSNLLLLLQQESNEEVAFWQRSRKRHGGHQLVSIPQQGVARLDLKAIPWWPGAVVAWDLARSRREIYLLVHPRDGTGPATVMVRRLDGTTVRNLGWRLRPYPTGIALSPDERWLLVEHWTDRDYPSHASSRAPDVRRDPLASLNETLREHRRRIWLLSLVNDEAIQIAGDARYGSWVPDSQSVTYLRDWELWRFNLSDLKEERIAWREPSHERRPSYDEPPTWSSDGKHLVVCIGEDTGYDIPSLLLDFPRHEFIVVPMLLRGAVWSPIPRPFHLRSAQ